MAKLIFTNREFGGQVYSLITEKTTVGRSAANVLVLRHDTVSAHHCEIIVNDPEIIIRDLGSRNGTFVDGVQLVGQRQVKSGQVIRFGQVEAKLELGRPPEDDGSTSETAIRYHQQAMVDARRPKAAPEVLVQPEPVLAPASDTATDPNGQTIICAKPQERVMAPLPAAGAEPDTAHANRSSKAVLLAIAGVVLALAVVALVWWLRRGN